MVETPSRSRSEKERQNGYGIRMHAQILPDKREEQAYRTSEIYVYILFRIV
jgi:hypothetical protein